MTGTGNADSAMEAEFDVMARWTQEAVERLGADHAIPAGCRGSASPAALVWLGEACELAEGARLLDSGGGVGGAAAFAEHRFGVRPVVVDPMLGACRAATGLFGLPAVTGLGQRLPLASGSVDAAWCLGVLCTTTEKAAVLGELRRVLPRGAPLGLLVFVALTSGPLDGPEGNAFPEDGELAGLLGGAGFDLVQQADGSDLSTAPLSWTERMDAVERAVADAHGEDPRYRQAREQEDKIGRLLSDGHVAGRLLHAVAR